MMHRLTTNCAKNYCNRTLIVKVIMENVVRCFLGHSVYLLTLYQNCDNHITQAVAARWAFRLSIQTV